MPNIVNKNTGNLKRSSSKIVDTALIKNGPYEAEVINHLDSTHMGGLEVRLLSKDTPTADTNTSGSLIPVKYLSPFYGVTSSTGLSRNSGHTNTQKSYGMWFVPPDIGSRVLVIFSQSGQGYWIGCIQDDYMNMMIPAGNPATSYCDSGGVAPVAEYNKKTESGQGRDPTQYIKPTNEVDFDILKEQGLDKCRTRGLTTSCARRETPSTVFGMSTPGPLNMKGPTAQYGGDYGGIQRPRDRLGGSSLVFDDGDASLIRKTHPKDGPPEYANIEAGENPPTDIPHNEMIRLRTRTGHQIILHNSEDLIYICNSRGTAWVEMTSEGKIDIYTTDDLTVGCDANINLNAEKNICLNAKENISLNAQESIFFNAEENIVSNAQINIINNAEQNIHSNAQVDIHSHAKNNIHFSADNELHMTSNSSMFLHSDNDMNIVANADGKISVQNTLNLFGQNSIRLTASSSIDYLAITHRVAGPISTNPQSADYGDFAMQATEPMEVEQPECSDRVPQHEPWDEHENLHEEPPPEVPDTFRKGN